MNRTHQFVLLACLFVVMIGPGGPGHGGPAVVANTYLEGTYSEIYPDISQDETGLQKLFPQFSFPAGIPSHASLECPGSIHDGGELDYPLSHSFGAVSIMREHLPVLKVRVVNVTDRRANNQNIHVCGYKKEGTTTTAFDMTVLNGLDRFHLVLYDVDRVPRNGDKGSALKQQLENKLIEHKRYIDTNGQDMPEMRNWKWETFA